jgi:uncharacterized protein (UPF0332 family)
LSSPKEIKELQEKADYNLKAAETLIKDGFYDIAVSRAYYAMFYCATAVLLTKGLHFSKHSGVISAFNLHFIKPGIFPQDSFKQLRDIYEARSESDYALTSISKEEAVTILESAGTFVNKLISYLQTQ